MSLAQPGPAATLRPVWQPNGPVEALLLKSGVLYVGGSFSSFSSPDNSSSVARANLAALDFATGLPLAWDPGADGPVYCLEEQGSIVYVGGAFGVAGSLSASALAAIDVGSNTAQPWAPGLNGPVRALQVIGNSVYAGGSFSVAAGLPRLGLAELQANTPSATSFNAQLSGSPPAVWALRRENNDLYVGGSFSSVQGSPRAGLAQVDRISASLRPWDPGPSFGVPPVIRSLRSLAGALWVGGDFSGSFGGSPVQDLAALSLASAALLWAPAGTDAAVQTLAVDAGGRVHAGGSFSLAAGQARRRYAAYYQSGPQLEALSADLDAGSTDLRALLASGSELVLGGSFAQVDGQAAKNLAVLSLPALAPAPTATSTPASSLAPGAPAPQAFVFPQPGACGQLQAGADLPGPGRALLRIRTAEGTRLQNLDLAAGVAGRVQAPLDCGVLKPGLYWLEADYVDAGGQTRRLATKRFVVRP